MFIAGKLALLLLENFDYGAEIVWYAVIMHRITD